MGTLPAGSFPTVMELPQQRHMEPLIPTSRLRTTLQNSAAISMWTPWARRTRPHLPVWCSATPATTVSTHLPLAHPATVELEAPPPSTSRAHHTEITVDSRHPTQVQVRTLMEHIPFPERILPPPQPPPPLRDWINDFIWDKKAWIWDTSALVAFDRSAYNHTADGLPRFH